MFLFTTIDRPGVVSGAASGITGALQKAARATGIDFGYLLNTARRESSLDPQAKASTSSAAGLFQFIENTWLQAVHDWGGEHGLSRYAEAIEPTADGRYAVTDPTLKSEILDLRFDPQVSAMMAGEFTRSNAAELQAGIGRAPSAGELYIAHFLGARGAVEMVNLASQEPDAPAASHFPAAARANRSIFYDRSGNARPASDVYRSLLAKHESLPAGEATAATTAVAYLPERRGPSQEVFASLFTNDGAPAARAGGSTLGGAVQAMWLNFFGAPKAVTAGEAASPASAVADGSGQPLEVARSVPATAARATGRQANSVRHADPSLLIR